MDRDMGSHSSTKSTPGLSEVERKIMNICGARSRRRRGLRFIGRLTEELAGRSPGSWGQQPASR
ncbi:MAG: hypothetical protein ACP5IF_06035 [Conexivisphaera sp.]